MPNRDKTNKNISITIPDTLKKRMDIFIDKHNKKDALGIEVMTKRVFIVNAGKEYINNHGG